MGAAMGDKTSIKQAERLFNRARSEIISITGYASSETGDARAQIPAQMKMCLATLTEGLAQLSTGLAATYELLEEVRISQKLQARARTP